jgi:hypothetical protein
MRQRNGEEGKVFDFVKAAFVAEGLSAPQTGDHLECFIKHRTAGLRIGLLSDTCEAVIIDVADAYPKNHSATGEIIQRDRFACDFPGTPTRECDHGKP